VFEALTPVATVVGGIVLLLAYAAGMLFTGGAFPWPRRRYMEDQGRTTAIEAVAIFLEGIFFPIPWVIWGLGWLGIILLAQVMNFYGWACKLGHKIPSQAQCWRSLLG